VVEETHDLPAEAQEEEDLQVAPQVEVLEALPWPSEAGPAQAVLPSSAGQEVATYG